MLCREVLSTSCSRKCREPAAEQGLLQEGIGFGSSGGQEGAGTAFRSCPSARHPNSRHKRAKAFFPFEQPRGMLGSCPGDCQSFAAAPASCWHQVQLISLSVVTEVALETFWICFLFSCYFCSTADAICHLQVKELRSCCQWDVFLM